MIAPTAAAGQPRQQAAWKTAVAAGIYVLSGVAQPLLMTLAKDAGLADPTAQFYMVFYQLGPLSFVIVVWLEKAPLPSWPTRLRAGGLGMIDIVSQAMNYTVCARVSPCSLPCSPPSLPQCTCAHCTRALRLRRLLLRCCTGYCRW